MQITDPGRNLPHFEIHFSGEIEKLRIEGEIIEPLSGKKFLPGRPSKPLQPGLGVGIIKPQPATGQSVESPSEESPAGGQPSTGVGHHGTGSDDHIVTEIGRAHV